jgi:predicted SAM-dependent methyltransferase
MSLFRVVVETVNKAICKKNSKRRIKASKHLADVKLNLGCGLAVVPGWINIDGSLNTLVASMPTFTHKLFFRLTGANKYYSESEYCSLLQQHRFVHHDLSYGIPFHGNTIDYIFSSHFLEHLYRQNAIDLLKDSYRTLKNGGIIRISVPDLEYAISLYFKDRKDESLRNYFFIDEDNDFSRHKYMYDYEMLYSILKDIGFQDIKRHDFQKGSIPDVKLLDNRKEDSLFIEAKKIVKNV